MREAPETNLAGTPGAGGRLRVVFMGSPEFAVPSLRAVAAAHEVVAVLSQPDKPAGRGKALQAPAVKLAARELGLPVWQPERLSGPQGMLGGVPVVERLQVLAPDVLVVVAYGKLLPQAVLDVPRLGPFNVHASLLPRYRGAAPIQWAILRGETETGVSIMRMAAGLDTGPVLAVRATPIGPEETAGELFARLSRIGAELLVETLPEIAAGRAQATPQDDARATLAPMLRKEDGRLDFSQDAAAVSARARAVDPWPGAFVEHAGEPVKLYRPRVVAGAPGAVPGAVLSAGPQGLVVACGRDAVVFAELQRPGRKRLPAAAALAGWALPVGTVLGAADRGR